MKANLCDFCAADGTFEIGPRIYTIPNLPKVAACSKHDATARTITNDACAKMILKADAFLAAKQAAQIPNNKRARQNANDTAFAAMPENIDAAAKYGSALAKGDNGGMRSAIESGRAEFLRQVAERDARGLTPMARARASHKIGGAA